MLSSTTEFTANEPADIPGSVPVKLQKIIQQMTALKNRAQEHRKEANNICAEMTSLERMMEKYATKVTRENTKTSIEKRKRKPSGFASPTEVSEDLCSFMEKPFGSRISRTETSRYLSKYISENRLFNDSNKSIILPDDKLLRLLGSEATDAEITYFTIQKYINKHFIKNATREVSATATA